MENFLDNLRISIWTNSNLITVDELFDNISILVRKQSNFITVEQTLDNARISIPAILEQSLEYFRILIWDDLNSINM